MTTMLSFACTDTRKNEPGSGAKLSNVDAQGAVHRSVRRRRLEEPDPRGRTPTSRRRSGIA